MAERSESSRVIRAFVALQLPEDVRERIAAWGAEELSDPALRPVPREHLHVTLAFLGWQEEDSIAETAKLLGTCAGRAPALQLGLDPVAKPGGRRPNFFALEVSSPAASLLQAEVAATLADAGVYQPDERRFWPHVTLARTRTEKRQGGGRSKRRMAVRRAPKRLPQELAQPFEAVRLTLYRSILRSAGAQYDALAQFELPATQAALR